MSSEVKKLQLICLSHKFSEQAKQSVTVFRFRTWLVLQGKKILNPFSKVISQSIQETFKQMCDLGKELFSELKFLEISCKAFDKNIVV